MKTIEFGRKIAGTLETAPIITNKKMDA